MRMQCDCCFFLCCCCCYCLSLCLPVQFGFSVPGHRLHLLSFVCVCDIQMWLKLKAFTEQHRCIVSASQQYKHCTIFSVLDRQCQIIVIGSNRKFTICIYMYTFLFNNFYYSARTKRFVRTTRSVRIFACVFSILLPVFPCNNNGNLFK